ncbi:HNH endonuclease [Lichenibacterium ramalinae]|uniref:HNH endonuclease n=1 Tax=Lichenibacterium ramalinae TaxID=2316527 RepID=A0A4Q2RDL8_9HYPH|nr:HNH endonuclease [Lichenibacterium ramalinae]RYB04443.1 hypothetical protein D3272_13485 [Lichenibacterium ramalinae]
MPFTSRQRYAIYNVHLERCWICRKPLALSEMEVDHIIPASLVGTACLPGVLAAFGLPADFDLESYENWSPSCRGCNGTKGDAVFEPTPLIQVHLHRAAEKAPAARALEAKLIRKREIDLALNLLLSARETSVLDIGEDAAARAVAGFHSSNRQPELAPAEPFRLAPWLTIIGGGGGTLLLRNANGVVGARPAGERLHHSFDCPNCGPTGWNGARCISCMMLIDLD